MPDDGLNDNTLSAMRTGLSGIWLINFGRRLRVVADVRRREFMSILLRRSPGTGLLVASIFQFIGT